jgi:hypothetical protein
VFTTPAQKWPHSTLWNPTYERFPAFLELQMLRSLMPVEQLGWAKVSRIEKRFLSPIPTRSNLDCGQTVAPETRRAEEINCSMPKLAYSL